MPTQAEIVEMVKASTEDLKTAVAGIGKIGTETDGLQAKIAELQEAVNNQNNASPELVAAAQAVTEQASAVKAAVTAVDEKVPDPIVEPPSA